ncbi:hypothetical protein GGR50DRAFT_697913 [Xylaria sp. CBS 124048]|nr:hypothetical protein GGR50DRAFT_697913 [Xylaria sp. CBS 124048]
MGDSRESPKRQRLDEDGQDDHDSLDDNNRGSARKRQRVRLSCLECRRRKLSCSRELPCDRCIKSGTPERCTYESRPGGPPAPSVSSAAKDNFIPSTTFMTAFSPRISRSDVRQPPARWDGDGEGDNVILKNASRDRERIRKLELEVAQLRSVLAKQPSMDGSTANASPATARDGNKDALPAWAHLGAASRDPDEILPSSAVMNSIDLKTKYAGPHNLWSSLSELAGIAQFMKETSDEWLSPLNIDKKDRGKGKEDRKRKSAESDPKLESLLPSKEETDTLVAAYLDQFEQLYRIVHIPTFKRQYESFWRPNSQRPASLTVLVLSMISVSCCLGIQSSSKFIGVKSSAFAMAEKYVKSCDAWLDQQSHKHRKLVHYQIQCLLYLAKRVNIIKKKRFWATSGGIIRDAITIGLHQEPNVLTSDISPYNVEMRRRLWATMVEFDLQASFDLGVPTVLSQVFNHTEAPSNVDDDCFDEDSTELPLSRPRTEYTFSSFAHFSRKSLPLRLELCRLLTGSPIDLDWEQVLHYTDMITREIDALPAWDVDCDREPASSHKPSLTHTLLHIQLRQYLIPLHQPFIKLRRSQSKYQMAEFIYYTAARDLVLMHDRLFQKGIRTLYFLREDSIGAAINLCNISLLQPKNSQFLIASNHEEILRLVGICIALKEDRVLRCGNNDPWGYSTMCAAYGLIESHLGLKTPEAAKAQAAERFINLHYRLLSYQVSIPPKQDTQLDGIVQQPPPAPCNGPISAGDCSMTTSIPVLQPESAPLPCDGPPFRTLSPLASMDSSQLFVPNPDYNFGLLGLNLTDLWGDWSGVDFG